jgi:hypothetical protein
MQRLQAIKCTIVTVLAVFGLALVVGCSGGSSKDLTKDISGTWQRVKGDGTVDIHLSQEPLTVTVDGKTFPATITKVDDGSHSLHIKLENNGKPEEWILRQVWNDNGSNYTVAFIHDGTNEKLVSKQHS